MLSASVEVMCMYLYSAPFVCSGRSSPSAYVGHTLSASISMLYRHRRSYHTLAFSWRSCSRVLQLLKCGR